MLFIPVTPGPNPICRRVVFAIAPIVKGAQIRQFTADPDLGLDPCDVDVGVRQIVPRNEINAHCKRFEIEWQTT